MIKNKFNSLAICLGLLVLGTPFSLHADAILTVGDANYVGLINDGIPANPANEVIYINTLTTLAPGAVPSLIGSEIYDRLLSTLIGPFDTVVIAGAVKNDLGVDTITLAGSFQYILGKYDASQAGSIVWYFDGGVTGDITVPLALNGKGISHISAYNLVAAPVPEPSALALLGLCLGFLGIAHRRKMRKENK